MEKRTIEIDLETAKEWYKGNNSSLKTIALQAFTKEELERVSYEDILDNVSTRVFIDSHNFVLPTDLANHYTALTRLQIIAQYFNGNWKKTPSNIGYFLGYKEKNPTKLQVLCHTTVKYPGIVYFQYENYAYQAMKILDSWKEEL